MNRESTVLHAPIKLFKRTKIIATVGPSTNSYKAVLSLIKSGADGLRLNFSHGTNNERDQQIKWIREASKELKKPVAIIQDLQGPKIRLGDFDGEIHVKTGEELIFAYNSDYSQTGHIPIQYDLSKKVKKNERLYLFDGRILTVIEKIKNNLIHVRARNSGVLVKRKGINLPDTDFGGDIITIKDKQDLAYGAKQDIDYVALSFIQNANDIKNLHNNLQELGSNAKIIAKVETKQAVDNLDEIMQKTDAVMIARGDLAIETSAESVPILQRKIIELGKKYAKPSIVATQMLASMTERPEPTRAEVSDIATAVILGVDSVMLSDETASGQYPIESINMMKRVIDYTQKNTTEPIMTHFADVDQPLMMAIPKAVIGLAREMSATAIVAETKSGGTAINISALRPNIPVLAVTSSNRVDQQLSIVYGTKSYVRPEEPQQAVRLTNWLLKNNLLSRGDIIVTASAQHPGMIGTTDTIKVRVL